MLPEKEKIWSYNTFSKILDRFGKTLIGWLCTGLLSADFRIEGKIDELIDLFAQPKMKEEKKSTFCFKISVGISDELDALFLPKLFISFSTSLV